MRLVLEIAPGPGLSGPWLHSSGWPRKWDFQILSESDAGKIRIWWIHYIARRFSAGRRQSRLPRRNSAVSPSTPGRTKLARL